MRPEESTRSPVGPLARGRRGGNAGSARSRTGGSGKAAVEPLPKAGRSDLASAVRGYLSPEGKRRSVRVRKTSTGPLWNSLHSCWRDRPVRCLKTGFGARVELATVGLSVRCSTIELSMEHITGVEPVASGIQSRRSTVELHARLSDRPGQHPYMSRQSLIMRVAINGRAVDVCAGSVTGDEVILQDRAPMQPTNSRE